ncbi:LCP family protein [bacterium]|nr:LCP family protein [bacterium]
MYAQKLKSEKQKFTFNCWQWLGLAAGLFLGVAALFAWQAWSSYKTFLASAGLDDQQLLELWARSRERELPQTDGRINALLLGTDILEYRDASTPLTDTMMLTSLDLSAGKLYLLPLARDTCWAAGNVKLNSIYASFYHRNPETAREEMRKFMSEATGIPLHYVAVINLYDVRDFIDLIGGVEVDVEQSFTDYQYPRDDVDINKVFDPALLYETVSFEAGPTHLDGDLALKFMRSRHAQNNEGSDFARSRRQQKVISAVVEKVSRKLREQLLAYDLSFLGQLYQFYEQRFENQIPFVDGLALLQQMLSWGHLPEVVQNELSDDVPGGSLQENKKDFTLRIT